MSWFPISSDLTSLAKNALKEAQKTIDKALDIKEDGGSNASGKGSVSTMAGAASDFFNSWGASIGTKSIPKAENPTSTLNTPITLPPKAAIPKMLKSPSSPIPNGRTEDNYSESNSTLSVMRKSITAVEDLSCELVAADSLQEFRDEAGNTFQSLWVDDPPEIIGKCEEVFLQHPKPLHINVQKAQTSSRTIQEEPILIPSSLTPNFQELEDRLSSFETSRVKEILAENTCNDVITEHFIDFNSIPPTEVENDNLLRSPQALDAPHLPFELEGDLDSSAATTIVSGEPDCEEIVEESGNNIVQTIESKFESVDQSEGDEQLQTEGYVSFEAEGYEPVEAEGYEPLETEGHILLETEDHVRLQNKGYVPIETEGYVSHQPEGDSELSGSEPVDVEPENEAVSSKLSVSSRATSSISVISEKDPSSPQISPNSQHLNDEVESPSFEVVSTLHHHHPPGSKKSDSISSFDLLTSSSGHPYPCQSVTSSVSVIPSLQSTPDRGTPLTHSRSNSNTSSSFDRIEDTNRPKLPGTHFISSTSSSDIEVIPFDSLENLHLLHRKRKSVVEVDTQTFEPWPEKVEPKVLEMIPSKVAALLEEKDSEILQLREEGEKLSKKQFELTNALKKLRQTEKDTDGMVKALKSELGARNTEIDRLGKVLIAKETQEQTQSATINRLNSENRRLLNTNSQLRSDLEDAQENTASMKASVEDASVEILDLQNTLASVQRDTTELDRLSKINIELNQRADSLQKEVEQLRQSFNTLQHKSSSRESELKTHIASLTHQIHILEAQLGDNSSDIADATMPLSLEIEKLQHELNSRSQLAERREIGLQNRVVDLESKLKALAETDRNVKSTHSFLESTIRNLEQEKEKLSFKNSQLSTELAKELAMKMEASLLRISEIRAKDSKINEVTAYISEIRKENETLRTDLKSERNSFQLEMKKNQALSEQIKLYTNHSMERVSISSGPKLPGESPARSSPGSIISDASYLEDILDPHGTHHTNGPCMTPKSFFDTFPSANFIENLQGQLRIKEVELNQLHDEVMKNEKIRRTLNEEIAHLTVNNQELLQRVETMDGLQQKLVQVEGNYNAVLQMYGEKVEESDELRMDLEDVKEMYKVQIEQLLKRS